MRYALTIFGFLAAAFLQNPHAWGAAKEEPKAEPFVEISTSEDARWTDTTVEAATAPEHKQALERAKKATVSGEVIDLSCYLQLGKRGEAHASCGSSCVRNGQPYGLLDDGGKITLIIEEQHHPRRDGQVSLREQFAHLMGRRVKAVGMLAERQGWRALFVQAPPKMEPKAEVVATSNEIASGPSAPRNDKKRGSVATGAKGTKYAKLFYCPMAGCDYGADKPGKCANCGMPLTQNKNVVR